MSGNTVGLSEARAPDGMRLYAIGDVHGRLDLLWALHQRIREEIERDGPSDWRIIHLGDYVDRGPDSCGVIDFLIEAQARDPRNIALAGNHDLGLIEFLANPTPNGLFASHGGEATARSYGVELELGDPVSLALSHADLSAAVPVAHRRFIRKLPLSVSFGDYFFCHAGVRPGVPLDRQSPDDLVSIRQAFHGHKGLFEKVVVHGHTPVGRAQLLGNRINIDTGAYFSGLMTAIALDGAEKRLIETAGPMPDDLDQRW